MPLQDRDIERAAALTAALASAGLSLLLLGAALLARRMLDRQRLAAWDAAWRANGPRWTIQH